MPVTAAPDTRATMPPSESRAEKERWDAWKARYAAADRRTAAMMRVVGAIVLLAATGWTVWALVL